MLITTEEFVISMDCPEGSSSDADLLFPVNNYPMPQTRLTLQVKAMQLYAE